MLARNEWISARTTEVGPVNPRLAGVVTERPHPLDEYQYFQ